MQVEDRLQSEHQRASHYFRNTEDAIIQFLKDHLLTPHLEAVLAMSGSGLDNMIDQTQHDDLARLYNLFVLVPEGIPSLKRSLKDSIAERGRIVNETEGSGADVDADMSGPPSASAIKSKRTDPDGDVDIDGLGDDSAAQSKSVASKGKAKERSGPNAKAGASRAPPPPATKKTLDAALKWVQDVLDLKDVFDKMLKLCFKDDKGIQTAMNEVRLLLFSSLPS